MIAIRKLVGITTFPVVIKKPACNCRSIAMAGRPAAGCCAAGLLPVCRKGKADDVTYHRDNDPASSGEMDSWFLMPEHEDRVDDAEDAGGNEVARMRDLMDALGVEFVAASAKPTKDTS